MVVLRAQRRQRIGQTQNGRQILTSDPTSRLTVQETAVMLGYKKGCLLRRFVREGLLPYPRQNDLTYAVGDVLAVKAWMDAKKRRSPETIRRPDHRTW